MVMSGSNSTVKRKRYSVTLNKSVIVMKDMEEQLCKIYKLIKKHLLSLAKSVVFSPDSCEACLQYHERRANVVQKAKSSKMASVYIVICMPTHFTDLSENSPSSPNQFKLREE